MKFDDYQKQDIATMGLTEGAIAAWERGLGKTLLAYALSFLWCAGYTIRNRKLVPNKPVLIVAPGDLHDQIREEGLLHFHTECTPLDSQATFHALNQGKLDSKMRPVLPDGFYITSFTQLASNGVTKPPDPDKFEPRVLLDLFSLGDKHAAEYFDRRAEIYKEEYAAFELDATKATLRDVTRIFLKLEAAALRYEDKKKSARYIADMVKIRDVLLMLVTNRAGATYYDLDVTTQQNWVIRQFLKEYLKNGMYGVGELTDYRIPDLSVAPSALNPDEPATIKYSVRCVYDTSLADLSYNAFHVIMVDEGTHFKGEDTLIGSGMGQMECPFVAVMTATAIKNRLPDIFPLCQRATGGHMEATPRWPFGGHPGDRDDFAGQFLVSESNVTKGKAVDSRYNKLTPQVCNIHRLWKLLGPIVLRRKMEETGLKIVGKTTRVIPVEMGFEQRRVYEYHLKANYLDRHLRKAVGPQYQALRMAATDPTCDKLHAQPGGVWSKAPTGTEPIVRSAHSYTPKVDVVLNLVEEILGRGEQVLIGSAFLSILDQLSTRLTAAQVPHASLDGRVSQGNRGKLAKLFKLGPPVNYRHIPRRTDYAGPPDPETPFFNPTPSEFPVALGGIESVAEGHNFYNVRNVIVCCYTWAMDKVVQFIGRVHRRNSPRNVNIYFVICNGTMDRRLQSNISDKNDASDLVLDGQLMTDRGEEISMFELLSMAREEFDATDGNASVKECELVKQWPALRNRLAASARKWKDSARGLAREVQLITPPCAIPTPQFVLNTSYTYKPLDLDDLDLDALFSPAKTAQTAGKDLPDLLANSALVSPLAALETEEDVPLWRLAALLAA